MVLLAESYAVGEIQKRLQEEGISVSKTSLCLLLKKYKERGTVQDLRWYRAPTLLSNLHYRFIDTEVAVNSDLTSTQLHQRMKEVSYCECISLYCEEGQTYVGMDL